MGSIQAAGYRREWIVITSFTVHMLILRKINGVTKEGAMDQVL